MTCKNCIGKPVIQLTNNNVKLCKNHFIKYFEKKVKKTIIKFNLIEKDDKTCVAISGGKDSIAVLNVLSKIKGKDKKFRIEAILIDEGIKDYRDKAMKDAASFCERNNIKLNIFSYKEEFGYTLDEILKKLKIKFVRLGEYANSSTKSWEFLDTDMLELMYMIKFSDLVINTGSTMNIEAAILDKPIINVAFDGYTERNYRDSVRQYYDQEHLVNIVKTGGVKVAYGKEELLAQINELLENPKIIKLMHNGKFDYGFIKLQIGAKVNNIYDTMIAERIITTGIKRENSLGAIAKKYLGVTLDKDY